MGSFIGGMGNSVIWLVQGVFLDKNEMADFYALFNINIIMGNVLGLIVLLSGLSPQIMIFLVSIPTTIGTVLSLFLKEKDERGVEVVEGQKNEKFSLFEVFVIWKQIYLLFLIFIYQAVGLNVTYQIIPRLAKDPLYNTIIFIVYGVFAMLSSWLSGKSFLRNWKFVVIGYSAIETICLILILIFGKLLDNPGYYILIGALRGIIDYSVNNVINITLSQMKKENVKNYFSLYRFIYAIAYLLTSVCVGYISYEYILLICFIFLVSSSLFYFIFKKVQDDVILKDIEKQFIESEILI
jgi:predicted MFS family arabinose efflux permease